MMAYETYPSSLKRHQSIRHAVLKICHDPSLLESFLSRRLSSFQWRRLLRWLDSSGLTLYFFDRVCERRAGAMLPSWVLVRLEGNLRDNKERTDAMMEELAAIHREFEASHLSYAVLKGISLWPLSVEQPWLRSQADIDFLVAANDAPGGRAILEAMGFHLHAISGRSWEFRTDQIHTATRKNMYKVVPFRCVEMHLETRSSVREPLLSRTHRLAYRELEIPVLAPHDLFLGQALHLAKHVCSEFFRASHVLEFHRHVLARGDDQAFWEELRVLAERDSTAPLKLGLVVLLTTELLGPFAPKAFSEWTVERVPPAARLWITRYGLRCALGLAPGTKLYLLLQNALEVSGISPRRSKTRSLLPRSLPSVATAPPGESFRDRCRRYRVQIRFLQIRFRFHVAEGMRYLYESHLWAKELARLRERNPTSVETSGAKQRSDNSLTHA